MLHGYLRQSTASQIVVVGPFISDSDFKTAQTALTIANTDVKLSKNGAATVNKNSGGGTHLVSGNYTLTLDATDSNTVGSLFGSIAVAGALQVVFKFMVLEEAVYDAMFASAADLNAAALANVQAGVDILPTLDEIGDELETNRQIPAKLTNVPAQPTGVFEWNTANLEAIIAYIGMFMKHKIVQTTTEQTVYADDGTTPVATAATSADVSQATRGAWVTSA